MRYKIVGTPDNSFHKCLVGIAGVAPYINEQILSEDGINVFLARDAARDFTTALIMSALGLVPAKSIMYHLGRKNMGSSYEVMKNIVEAHSSA